LAILNDDEQDCKCYEEDEVEHMPTVKEEEQNNRWQ
jgi:hypothetical protein